MSTAAHRLLSLTLRDFRNLKADPGSAAQWPSADGPWQPGPRFNVISGDNGQGKSNLLEAIDYLGTLHSFRGARAEDMIAAGADAAMVSAQVAGDTLPHALNVQLKRVGARAVTLDGKRPRNAAGYARVLTTVLFHPGDLVLSMGGPEARRAWLDKLLVRLDPAYESSLGAYDKALRSRNRLLKAERPNRNAITAYDELLASAGAVIGQSRERILIDIAPSAAATFSKMFGAELGLDVAYQPRVTPEVAVIRKALAQALETDLARGFTADGPHGDDVAFSLNDTKAKRHASQGQHRAIALTVKIIELTELARRTGRMPLFLLDDVSSELDRTRNERLFALLSHLGAQVFLTTTHPELIRLDHDRHDYRVEAGMVKRMSQTHGSAP